MFKNKKSSAYFQLIPAISICFLLTGCIEDEEEDETVGGNITYPDVATYVSDGTITVDGAGTDWGAISSIITDPSGDGGVYDGLDVTAVYVAQDADYLYIRTDLVGTSKPSNEYNYWFFFEGSGFSFAVEAYHDPSPVGIRLWDITGANRNYANYSQLSASLSADTTGSLMEIRVPKNLISTSVEYNVDVYTHYTVSNQWQDNGDYTATGGRITFIAP